MGDFIRIILDSLEYLWPFRIVHQWEQGGYYVCGRFWKVVGPGCYPVFPFFVTMLGMSTVPYMVATPRMDVTLHDGKNLTLWATAWAQVKDFDLAHNTVDNYEHTTTELIQAIIADRLAKIDSTKLEAENRAELLRNLSGWCDKETKEYGVEITRVRFTTFVLNARTYRLIQ